MSYSELHMLTHVMMSCLVVNYLKQETELLLR